MEREQEREQEWEREQERERASQQETGHPMRPGGRERHQTLSPTQRTLQNGIFARVTEIHLNLVIDMLPHGVQPQHTKFYLVHSPELCNSFLYMYCIYITYENKSYVTL